MRALFIDSIEAISTDQWNSVSGTDYPFTRYEFLHALEMSGAADLKSGWQAQHLLIYADNQLLAVMPLYLKQHSYGEYVFDWAWAEAYHRNGINYYPKLLSAIPFTPATGPRLCIKPGTDKNAITQFAVASIYQQAEKLKVSSIQVLFPESDQCDFFDLLGLSTRRGVQYHWFNHDFNHFDDFLATFSSRKRKNLNKERRRVAEQGLRLEVIEGRNISSQSWQRFYYFYQMTYAKRSGHGGYLNQQFFENIASTMAEHLVLVLAYKDDGGTEAIAGALNFRDSTTLYGRYWGCTMEFEFLHFEACYYQGIEYCIANKLQRFDPGAQGEHKIQRGFNPIETWSNHWIAQPDFRRAINDFLLRDNEATSRYIEQAAAMLPFKKSINNEPNKY